MKLFEYNKRREREREREPGATEVGTTQVDGIIFDSFKEEEEEKSYIRNLIVTGRSNLTDQQLIKKILDNK